MMQCIFNITIIDSRMNWNIQSVFPVHLLKSWNNFDYSLWITDRNIFSSYLRGTILDRYITRILEAGLIDYWHRTLTEDYRRSQGLPSAQTPPEKDPLRPLSVEDIQGPFIAAAFGLGAATVVFLVEVLSFHAKRVGTNWDQIIDTKNICVNNRRIAEYFVLWFGTHTEENAPEKYIYIIPRCKPRIKLILWIDSDNVATLLYISI